MIMRRAWVIARTTGKAFAVALAKSWQLYRLVKQMQAGVVRFSYEKADGTLRRALGTLKDVAELIKGTGGPMTVRRSDITTLRRAAFGLFGLQTWYQFINHNKTQQQ